MGIANPGSIQAHAEMIPGLIPGIAPVATPPRAVISGKGFLTGAGTRATRMTSVKGGGIRMLILLILHIEESSTLADGCRPQNDPLGVIL